MSALLDQAVKACLRSGEYSLPLLPESTGRLLELLQSTGVDFGEVEQLVSCEAALAARVLRVANSTALRGSREVSSIREAITRLGTRQVTRIALSEQVASVFNVPGFEDLARANWWDARMSSLYASAVAGEVGADTDTAFVCGLLHAVGRPIVLQTVVQIAGLLNEPQPRAAVQGWVEAWYADVGLSLVKSWGLPEVVQAAIQHHKRPEAAEAHATMCAITALSGMLTRSSPPSEAALTRLAEHPVCQSLDISAERLIELVDPTLSGLLAA